MSDKKASFSKKLKYFIRKQKYYFRKFWYLHKFKILITSLILSFAFVYFQQSILISIKPGEAGVLWYRLSGTETEQSFGEGLHMIYPWDIMYIYNTRVQSVSDSMAILTSQGLTVRVNFTYRFYPDMEALPQIHKTLGPDYNMTYVKPEVEAAAMSIIGNYTPEKLYQLSTQVIQAIIKQYVLKQLYDRDIMLEDFLIKKIQLPSKIANAIEDKQSREQLLLEYNYRIGIAEKEKDRKVIEADGIKQFENISGLSMLKWRGLEVTEKLSTSPNSKVIVIGTSEKDLPIILNSGGN